MFWDPKPVLRGGLDIRQISRLQRDLIYCLEIPRADPSTKADDTIFTLQLAPWQGVHTLICHYVRIQRAVNFLVAYVNYTHAVAHLVAQPQPDSRPNWFSHPQFLYIFNNSPQDLEILDLEVLQPYLALG